MKMAFDLIIYLKKVLCLKIFNIQIDKSITSYSGFDNSVSSLSEVSVSLGLSGGDEALGVLGHASSGRLGALSSKISWEIFFVFMLGLCGVSSLLVEDGKNLSDGLSNNL